MCIRDRYRGERRPIVYTDETYFHSSISVTKTWTDSDKSGLINKGQRVVVVHAGGETGFVSNALLMFKSGFKKKRLSQRHELQKLSACLKKHAVISHARLLLMLLKQIKMPEQCGS